MNLHERLEEAMVRLATTDAEFARLETNAELMEEKAKTVKATVYLHEEGSVADRQAKAQVSPEYWQAFEQYIEAKRASLELWNQRKTEDNAIRVCQTIEASRRRA